jgi:hypothetical protein
MTLPTEGLWRGDRQEPDHRWGEPIQVTRTKIERVCPCGCAKVTMVLPRHAWREWRLPGEVRSWRGTMPACRGAAK